ncbi:MAG: DUF1207 domain-containing protein [Pirellulales bacterium]
MAIIATALPVPAQQAGSPVDRSAPLVQYINADDYRVEFDGVEVNGYRHEASVLSQPAISPYASAGPLPDAYWTWQLLPDGLLYRAYLAGMKESRLAGVWHYDQHAGWLLDATLGGRVGLLRYGSVDARFADGWQLDVEGASFPRLNLEQEWDLDSADFRVGVPLTFARGPYRVKLAYYHLSSHLGDELAIRQPATLASRINYSRDVVVVGMSYYPLPVWRLYGETGYAVADDGGSEPWEFQFGVEFAPACADSYVGAPVIAVGAHLHEEVDFGGQLTAMAGWQWQGISGHTFRTGVHYLNGKSSQFQFFDQSEEHFGWGIWYDF